MKTLNEGDAYKCICGNMFKFENIKEEYFKFPFYNIERKHICPKCNSQYVFEFDYKTEPDSINRIVYIKILKMNYKIITISVLRRHEEIIGFVTRMVDSPHRLQTDVKLVNDDLTPHKYQKQFTEMLKQYYESFEFLKGILNDK